MQRNSKGGKALKKKKSILVAVLNQGSIRVELANVLMMMSHDPRYALKIYYPSAKPIEHNRNQIVQKFKKENHDYLLMIDSDTVPHRNPLDLVELGKDIIGLPCPQWYEKNIYWVVMDDVPQEKGVRQIEPKRRKGLVKVDAVGTGAILIARRVLLGVKAPFMRKWDSDGIAILGLDFYFCEKARKLGFEVYAHFDYPCGHYKELDLWQIIEMMVKDQKSDV